MLYLLHNKRCFYVFLIQLKPSDFFLNKYNVNHQDISIFKIISPVWPDFSLSSNVPDVELEPLGLDRLDVEALCRGNVSCVLGGQSFKNCCFASIVLDGIKLINIGTLVRVEASSSWKSFYSIHMPTLNTISELSLFFTRLDRIQLDKQVRR